jgi:hypothetical protein
MKTLNTRHGHVTRAGRATSSARDAATDVVYKRHEQHEQTRLSLFTVLATTPAAARAAVLATTPATFVRERLDPTHHKGAIRDEEGAF